MNVTTVITVNGTRKSEQFGGLDDREVSRFTIKPGQYDRTVNGPDDLIEQISRSAFFRGEWISSLQIGDVDVVSQYMCEAIIHCHGDIENAINALQELGMFSNADAQDLKPLVALAASANRGLD